MKKIDIIAGARPNFVKIAPIIHAIKGANTELCFRLIHTGQHYDKNMSGSFFEQLDIPEPEFNLEVGSGTQAEQTASIMLGYEKILLKEKSDCCLVVGDVTSTMACAIVAQKLHVPVAHVEGGIRSGDWSMPEEINRMVTDSITNWFFTTSEHANRNLQSIGVADSRIFFVGNTMIDTLKVNLNRFRKPPIFSSAKLHSKSYFVLTLHRPANVDDKEKLKKILNTIIECSRSYPVVFPVHPRTGQKIKNLEIANSSRLLLCEPLGYLEFNYLVQNAFAVITDSGGITEEATFLNVPCLTARDNTERPETIELGSNELIGTDPTLFFPHFLKLFDGKWKTSSIPPMWDGCASERIIQHLIKLLNEPIVNF